MTDQVPRFSVVDSDRDPLDGRPLTLTLDRVFEALSHPRRRYLLYSLLEADDWSIDELARKVVAWEQDMPVETVTDAEAERMHVSLYHNHIPKLAEDGIIEFVATKETIMKSSNTEQVLNVLDHAGGSTDADQEDHARRNSDDGHT